MIGGIDEGKHILMVHDEPRQHPHFEPSNLYVLYILAYDIHGNVQTKVKDSMHIYLKYTM